MLVLNELFLLAIQEQEKLDGKLYFLDKGFIRNSRDLYKPTLIAFEYLKDSLGFCKFGKAINLYFV